MNNFNQYLYDKIVEESVRGSGTCYRPAHLAASPWIGRRDYLQPERGTRRCLLCVRFAGMPVVRIRLPRWVSVSYV